MRIGIDFGGVLTETSSPPETDYSGIPQRPDSLETIQDWKVEGHKPLLISKAGNEDKEFKARQWLDHHGFSEIFGEEGLLFCRTRKGKVNICRENKVDVMIDDTISQLELLTGTVLHLVLFNADEAPHKNMRVARNWDEVRKLIRNLQH